MIAVSQADVALNGVSQKAFIEGVDLASSRGDRSTTMVITIIWPEGISSELIQAMGDLGSINIRGRGQSQVDQAAAALAAVELELDE